MRFWEQDRPSDSPLIERIWRSHSDQGFGFLSRAATHSELVIARHRGMTTVTVRGPETVATEAFVSAGTECLGIVFKLGTFIPSLLPGGLLDRRDADLPLVTGGRFQLGSGLWEIPTFENADTFVAGLIRRHILVHDPEVVAELQDPTKLSRRVFQYRIARATGLSFRTMGQIEKAEKATALLSRGLSILDTVFEAGYFDQPHLTRSLKRYTGLTPRQISQAAWSGSLLLGDGTGFDFPHPAADFSFPYNDPVQM